MHIFAYFGVVFILKTFIVPLFTLSRRKRKYATRENKLHLTYREYLETEIQVTLLKYLPLRTLSRLWGHVNMIRLPVFLRCLILGSYSRTFGCHLEEAKIQDLRKYSNLSEFFRRSLKPGLRPIASGNVVVSPADGTVIHCGKVINGRIEQIKGVDFSVRAFLGPYNWNKDKPTGGGSESDDGGIDQYQRNLLSQRPSKDTSLYNCVIYLAPGDYHRFHSPCYWSVNFRRHFPGELFSVHPSFVSWVKGLFSLNERVCYLGSWIHGFFSMTAVGATNVGSVKAYFDKELRTNRLLWKRNHYNFDDRYFDKAINFTKGDAFGEFNLGSTIVLIFEAPNDAEFSVKLGDKVKYGQLICRPTKRSCSQSNLRSNEFFANDTKLKTEICI